MIDDISVPHMFCHLFDTVVSLSVRGAFCSSQALVSLVVSFQHLEVLDLDGFLLGPSETPRSLPEQHSFKGTLRLLDLDDSSEESFSILAQYVG